MKGMLIMYLEELGKKAAVAKYEVQLLSTEAKNKALKNVAIELIANTDAILAANAIDIKNGEENNMHIGLLDRLRLTPDRIKSMAEGIEQIIDLEDPIGEVLENTTRPNGMVIQKVRVPMGVIGIIYESRPNVTADAFALCFKTGNAVILKGGKDAIHSNKAITDTIRLALAKSGINEDAILLIEKTDRETTKAFMQLNDYIDVLIPRGGAGLIKAVVENSTIPVIETGTGNCHVFVDETADFEKALNIIFNAKTQRIGVCNACESLVIHEKIKDAFLPLLAEKLSPANVELRCDEASLKVLPKATAATAEDFYREYLDYILSVKVVSDVTEAIAHINEHNTGHSDCIVSADETNIDTFLKGVDSACVYANVSTRFTDGFEFGFGAEIGISTQKLHARGPMGLKELTSYKYLIKGNGQIR